MHLCPCHTYASYFSSGRSFLRRNILGRKTFSFRVQSHFIFVYLESFFPVPSSLRTCYRELCLSRTCLLAAETFYFFFIVACITSNLNCVEVGHSWTNLGSCVPNLLSDTLETVSEKWKFMYRVRFIFGLPWLFQVFWHPVNIAGKLHECPSPRKCRVFTASPLNVWAAGLLIKVNSEPNPNQ